jgi:hypothetical protein
MNASSPPRPPRRRPAQAHCGKPARRLVTSLLVGSLSLLSLSSCSDDANGSAAPTATPSSMPSPTATPIGEQAALLAQYRNFWASLTPIQQMPAASRRSALAEFAVEPALSSLLAGMATTDAKGQQFYGANVPRASQAEVTPDGMRAVVDDCQDTSQAGLAEKATGNRLTVGVPRSHVVVTLQRTGGVWKVSFVSYPKAPC